MFTSQDVFPDTATERKILSMAIRCPSEGCEWIGELKNREDHLRECPMFRVACHNYCGLLITRETVLTHVRDECPLTLVSCPYAGMGCEATVSRQAMESHLNTAMNLHLNLACVRFQKTIVELVETRSQLQATRLQLERTKEELDTTTFVWKIDGFGEIFREAMAGRNQTINSDPFYTKNGTGCYGYKLKVQISPNDQRTNQLSVFIIVMKGEYDAILPWPFTKKVKFTLIDQQADLDQRRNETAELFEQNISNLARPVTDENRGRGIVNFISHQALFTRRYIVDDTLFLQVEISKPSK